MTGPSFSRTPVTQYPGRCVAQVIYTLTHLLMCVFSPRLPSVFPPSFPKIFLSLIVPELTTRNPTVPMDSPIIR